MKKKEFEDIYAAAFTDPREWRRWFIDTVVGENHDDDIILISDTAGRAAASALLTHYTFIYAGSELPSGYISCVATKPEARAHGLASQAMTQTLQAAYDRGYAFAELIPATRSLYGFYSRFGFADAFYADEERYTALHTFDYATEGSVVPPSYDIFHALEMKVGCGVVHSENDFSNIIGDLGFESGRSVLFVQAGESFACLFASWDSEREGDTVTVRSLLADNETAACAALRELRRLTGERPITVWRPPVSGNKAHLRVRGMARIVHAQTVLQALAEAHPSLHYTIRLHDSLLHANDGFYTIANGRCMRTDTPTRTPDLEVTVSVLTSILFSAEKIGNIFLLPTRRPYMSLMLDQ